MSLAGAPLVIGLTAAGIGVLDYFANNYDLMYEDDLNVIEGYASYNHWRENKEWYNFVYGPDDHRYSVEFVRNILNTYMNLLLKEGSTLPEYDAYDPEIKKRITEAIQRILPYSDYDIQRVMDATDYAVRDGQAKITALLQPKTMRDNIDTLQNPDLVMQQISLYNGQREEALLEQLDTTLKSAGKFLLLGGVAVAGVIIASKMPQRRT